MEECDDDYSKMKDSVRSPSPVKSTAVVKYSSVQSPVDYARLKCNTDLNMPPSNWLSSAADSYGLRQIYTHSSGFSSFRMAHMFPDCVGEVDVVSGAECIKTLLKLPYHPNGTVSMMVHRVENTLLLDNFDIYQYLMKSEWAWLKSFFYDHILKSLSEKDKLLHIHNKKRLVLQRKMLLSKFLYHSLVAAPAAKQSQNQTFQQTQFRLPLTEPTLPEPDSQGKCPGQDYSNHTYNRNVVWTFEDIQMLIGSDMPIFGGVNRPCVSLRLCDASEPINVLTGIDYWLDNLMCNVPEVIMCYHLDGIVQKYEPIKTEDLPHMEDSKFSPKVIKNVAQNILSFLKSNATKAGHTYWLFKGTHDDVVKLYDLTSLCGGVGASDANQNPFTIPVAMLLYRVARNMRNSGEGKNVKVLLENCVKLLSDDSHPQILASSHYMLADLYVPVDTDPAAPNFQTEECKSDDSDGGPFFEECDEDNENDDEDKERDIYENSPGQLVYMGNLTLNGIGDYSEAREEETQSKFRNKTPIALSNCPEERCRSALMHVIEGLKSLHHYADCGGKYQQKKEEEEKKRMSKQKIMEEMNPKMAKPFQPIPMEYEPLGGQQTLEYEMANPGVAIPMPDCQKPARNAKAKRNNKSNSKIVISGEGSQLKGTLIKKDKTIPKWEESNEKNDAAWKRHLKTLLYEKACLVFATLSEYYYSMEKYGSALKYIISSQRCQKLLSNEYFDSKVIDNSCILGRAGDCFFKFAKNWDKYTELYQVQLKVCDEIDNAIMEEVKADMETEEVAYGTPEFDMINYILDVNPPKSLEDLMSASCLVYKQALDVASEERKEELMRRMASVKNELGVRYMHCAQEHFNKFCQEVTDAQSQGTPKTLLQPEYETLSKMSFNTLMEAARVFEQVNDMPNLALLYCNIGRYMRFKAHCSLTNTSLEQKRLYSLATEYYTKAKICLGKRECCPDVWDLVSWELSSALFTRACIMQDDPTHDDPQAAVEVADALKQSLKSCILSPGPRQCLYQFRAGAIYHRLGSLYHKQYREMTDETNKRKTILSLSKLNYEQGAKIFLQLEESTIFMTLQLEHIALMENQASVSGAMKLKCLQTVLQLLQQCQPALKLISQKDYSDEIASKEVSRKVASDLVDSSNVSDAEVDYDLVKLFEQRLQIALKNLIQVCMSKNCGLVKKESEKMTAQYKEMYSKTLTSRKFSVDSLKQYASHLHEILNSFNKYYSNNIHS